MRHRAGTNMGYGGDLRMWLQVGLASGAVVVLLTVLRRMMCRKSQSIDVGAVSESWLAEQRGRRNDSL